MSVQVFFHPLAAKEAREAEAWYSTRSPEAASRFRLAVLAASRKIADGNDTHRIGTTRFWYIRVTRFPYRRIFVHDNAEMARVLAVVHGRRRPGYWRSRSE